VTREETWRPAPAASLGVRVFDDEAVVYNGQTGSTHHLSVLGSVVLEALLRHPAGASFTALAGAVAGDAGLAVTDDLAGAVRRSLEELARLGLATNAAP
jgi:PqqD family protein of HPr-rel-A system